MDNSLSDKIKIEKVETHGLADSIETAFVLVHDSKEKIGNVKRRLIEETEEEAEQDVGEIKVIDMDTLKEIIDNIFKEEIGNKIMGEEDEK